MPTYIARTDERNEEYDRFEVTLCWLCYTWKRRLFLQLKTKDHVAVGESDHIADRDNVAPGDSDHNADEDPIRGLVLAMSVQLGNLSWHNVFLRFCLNTRSIRFRVLDWNYVWPKYFFYLALVINSSRSDPSRHMYKLFWDSWYDSESLYNKQFWKKSRWICTNF